MKIKYKLNKKAKLFLTIYFCVIVLCSALIIKYYQISNVLYSQQAANRWQGENDTLFSQNSVFFPSDERAAKNDIHSFREEVIRALSESGDDKLWIDAYSAESEITVTSEHESVTLQGFGVGGEYFFFHPLPLRSGSYISESDLSRDRIVLDESAAWSLFGSVDISEMEVKIDNKSYIVSGVVESEKDKFSNKTKPNKGRIYLSYDAFYELSNIDINSYEIVMPEPVSGFGYTLINNGFNQDKKEVINNSVRFNIDNILSKAMNIENMIIHNKGIAFPYFENAAKLVELKLVSILALIIPAIMFIIVSFLVFIKNLKRSFIK